MEVTDTYNDKDVVSLVVGVNDEPNADPTVGDLREQGPYYIADDVDVRRIQIGGLDTDSVPCAADNYQADDTDNDNLSFTNNFVYQNRI